MTASRDARYGFRAGWYSPIFRERQFMHKWRSRRFHEGYALGQMARAVAFISLIVIIFLPFLVAAEFISW